MKFLNWLPMFLGLMIPTTSLTQMVEVSFINGSVHFHGLCISVDDAFYLPCVLFGHSFSLENKTLCNLFQ